jgi:hypothetical protein
MSPAKYKDGDWRKPDRHYGPTELSPEQEAFLDWLTDPERSGTQTSLAAELGVDPKVLTRWKGAKLFRAQWDKRLAELNVSPERTQRIIESAYKIAVGEAASTVSDQLSAMKLYLQVVEKISPPTQRVVFEVERPAMEMTDEELADHFERKALQARSRANTIDVSSYEITTGEQLKAELARDASRY